MSERELDRASEAVEMETFYNDLVNLSNHQLRLKYKREAGSHRNRKAYSKENGWEFAAEWEEFRSFLADMGPVPADGYTLDRIDPGDERYGPGLCRWASKAEQTRNRKNTRYVPHGGEMITVSELAARAGKPYKTVHSALARGVSVEAIVAQPSDEHVANQYCPLRYRDDPDGLVAWYQRFREWKKGVRKDWPDYICPEVFDLAKVGKLLVVSEGWLRSQGYFELTPDEQDRAEELAQTELGRVYVHGPSWIDHGLEQLAVRTPKLASNLRIGPNRFRMLADLHEELLRIPSN